MKILVTGGYGLVGSEVVRQLAADPAHTVVAADLAVRPEDRANVIRIDNQAVYTNRNGVLDGVQSVICCAFSRSNRPDELAKGLQFTHQMFCALKRARLDNIINISSQGVYRQGVGIEQLVEGDEIGPQDAYGVAKYATECMLRAVFADGENITNIRLASVNMRQRFTQVFVNAILDGALINVSSAKQKTSLIDVQDVAAGLIAIATQPHKQWRPLYNLGTGRADTMADIVAALRQIAGERSLDVQSAMGDADPKPFALVNIDAIGQDFGFAPRVGLTDMLRHMWEQTLAERGA